MVDLNYKQATKAERNLLSLKKVMDTGAAIDELLGMYKVTELKELAAFVGIYGRTKMKKEQLIQELVPSIQKYGEQNQVYFVTGMTEDRQWTISHRESMNHLTFDVLYNSVYYRCVFKDGYCQVVERLYFSEETAEESPLLPDSEIMEQVAGLVEDWLDKHPTKAWWKAE